MFIAFVRNAFYSLHVSIRTPIIFNPGAAGAGDLRGLQAVTKTLHLVLELLVMLANNIRKSDR